MARVLPASSFVQFVDSEPALDLVKFLVQKIKSAGAQEVSFTKLASARNYAEVILIEKYSVQFNYVMVELLRGLVVYLNEIDGLESGDFETLVGLCFALFEQVAGDNAEKTKLTLTFTEFLSKSAQVGSVKLLANLFNVLSSTDPNRLPVLIALLQTSVKRPENLALVNSISLYWNQVKCWNLPWSSPLCSELHLALANFFRFKNDAECVAYYLRYFETPKANFNHFVDFFNFILSKPILISFDTLLALPVFQNAQAAKTKQMITNFAHEALQSSEKNVREYASMRFILESRITDLATLSKRLNLSEIDTEKLIAKTISAGWMKAKINQEFGVLEIESVASSDKVDWDSLLRGLKDWKENVSRLN